MKRSITTNANANIKMLISKNLTINTNANGILAYEIKCVNNSDDTVNHLCYIINVVNVAKRFQH